MACPPFPVVPLREKESTAWAAYRSRTKYTRTLSARRAFLLLAGRLPGPATHANHKRGEHWCTAGALWRHAFITLALDTSEWSASRQAAVWVDPKNNVDKEKNLCTAGNRTLVQSVAYLLCQLIYAGLQWFEDNGQIRIAYVCCTSSVYFLNLFLLQLCFDLWSMAVQN